MGALKNFNKNLGSLGLSSKKQITGLLFHTSSSAMIHSIINEDKSGVDYFTPYFSLNEFNKDEFINSSSYQTSLEIYKEYYLNSINISDDVNKPINKDLNKLIDSVGNKYEKFIGTELELVKNQRTLTIFESIGEIILKNEESIGALEILKLGLECSRFWCISPDRLSYTSSWSFSNILPTYLADVINSIPQPNNPNSNPETWLMSKEINNRIHDEKYNLDIETKKWIWSIHNFIFYINDPDKIELKTKYKEINGMNDMLSDVFLNIGMFDNLISSKYQFSHVYSSREHWKEFLEDLNDSVKNDYGVSIKNNFSNNGELYSFWSFRFINAVILYLV